MPQTQETHQELKARSEVYYKQIGAVACPALDEDVHFTSEGFNHLQYKKGGLRVEAEQRIKMKLLPMAKDIIGRTTTVQEYRRGIVRVGKPGTDGLSKTSPAHYWGFSHVFFDKNTRVRAIVRRVGNGQLHFWSVMPTWYEVRNVGASATRSFGASDIEDL
jgi:hypothetical protein